MTRLLPVPAAALLTVVFLLPLPLSAQQPDAAAPAEAPDPLTRIFADATDVQVVNVEAYVTRDGRPVLGLEPDDFRLFEDGEEVEITHFLRLEEGDPPPELSSPPAAAGTARNGGGTDGAHLIVYIDEVHMGPASRTRLFDQLEETLSATLRPEDRVMVASYDGGTRIRLPFTRDRRELQKTLEELRSLTALQLQADIGQERALQTIEMIQRSELGGDAQVGVAGVCVRHGAIAEQYAATAHARVRQSIDALTAFVNSLAGIPGRKAVLHVSDGIPLLPGGQVYEYAIELCDGSGARAGLAFAVDVTGLGTAQRDRWDPFTARNEMLAYDTTDEWQELAAHANAHHVTFYPVQVSGLRGVAPWSASQVQMTSQTARFGFRNAQDSLVLIAGETGGEAMLNRNDVVPGLQRMLRDSRSYYLLGFEPRSAEVGTRHRLRVEVDRPGVRVRHRQSYRLKGTHERVANGVLTALFYEREENPLGVGMTVHRDRSEEVETSKAIVRLTIPIDRLTLLPQGPSRRGLVTAFIGVRSADGSVKPIRQRSIPMSVPVEDSEEAFVYEIEVDLEPGEHAVAVALRDDLAGTTSYLRRTVDLSL